ncbi:retinol dehydrogenase 12 [Phaeosphaeriaceae sp. PMI808]|nr:retinol dehydrogenase 12 [Phaeosphaeriaceae sp. PMI808]
MGNQFSQAFPPKPEFTEATAPDLHGKVYIVTGASAGVGKELTRLLYSRNATVYLAARNTEKTNAAINWVKESTPSSKGSLNFLRLDLNDLEGIKASAEAFLAKEKRLDVLFNNAGVMVPPQGSTTKQGYELQMGTNCVAPFLFTKLLTPLLIETAKISPAGEVRVIWVSSSAADRLSPKGGVDVPSIEKSVSNARWTNYGVSKGGNVLHAIEYQKRYHDAGIVSVALNPGNLNSDLQRNMGFVARTFLALLFHPPVYGAYTELFAGLAPAVANAKSGTWVIPWGRIAPLRKDLADGGNREEFWEWSEKQVEKYA